MTLNYIECAGVRVPEHWTIEQLRSALEKRNIRFRKTNEEEIMGVFGNAILLKKQLEQDIDALKKEKAELIINIGKLMAGLTCPQCHTVFGIEKEPKKEENK